MMQVDVWKDNERIYNAVCCEINDLIYKDGSPRQLSESYNHISGSGRSVHAAILDFNETLRWFLNLYIKHAGDIPEFLKDNIVTYTFDQASFENYYLRTSDAKYNIFAGAGHDKLSGNILTQDLTESIPENPFYDKKVVFTGVLESISRPDAASKVQSLGADINSTISRVTDIVIVGKDAGAVKLEKINKYNENGAHIRIIYEPDFLELIKTDNNQTQ